MRAASLLIYLLLVFVMRRFFPHVTHSREIARKYGFDTTTYHDYGTLTTHKFKCVSFNVQL